MWTLGQLAEKVDGRVHGESDCLVQGVGTLKNATSKQISFLSNLKYKKFLVETKAAAVILNVEMVGMASGNAIVVDDPYVAYAKIAALLHPERVVPAEIHLTASVDPTCQFDESISIGPQAVIEENVELGQDVVIGPGCIIQQGSKIGSGSRLVANVTICRETIIGDNALIHPGVVLGADGFGIANDKGHWIKVPQLGRVKIGDNVEIGANTTIDRGALEDTIIGNGVKLDNQIQIGHNVIIDEHTVIAGCTGIAGSTHIGRACMIGGGVGISGHLEITAGVILTAGTVVSKSIMEVGVYSSGIPAETNSKWRKNVIRYRNLDTLAKKIKSLEKQINE